MRRPFLHAIAIFGWILSGAGCGSPLGPQYEYEEQLYLSVDGSATVVIDSSIPAFVALRGLPLSPDYEDPVDRDRIRELFAGAGCQNVRVGQPWVRRGRRFVQVRVSVDRLADLSGCGPLAWSTYEFGAEGDQLRFRQRLGEAAGTPPAAVNWTGQELVAFKLHVPSRIVFHNVRRIDEDTAGRPARGNILTWEQRLTDRLDGSPVAMDALMDSDSILYRTLWLFGGAFGAAVLLLVGLIWIMVWRARRVRDAAA